jgi:hypothetical protein
MLFAETRPVLLSYSNTRIDSEGESRMSQKKRRNKTTTQGSEAMEASQSTYMYQPSKSIKKKGSGCGCSKKTSK